MVPKGLKALRIIVVVILVLLGLQYEFGMAVNISNPPNIPPFNLSLSSFSEALNHVGPVAVIHASLGAWLVIFSVINLIVALRSRIRRVQIFSILALLSILLAAVSGLLFVQSGFQDDHFSHGMATNFLLTFVFYFLELYFLRPASQMP